ncbi:hypothetical protein [Haloarcula sp. JP-L23]|uniref:hypothetical protein n=1 Tax=Haloarcula sp. JP-L23 TaxID=2716717 RepID=UPI00140EECE1|nr:hypothetical protein G9465_18185 [Haloarcula sp. JP-L23]
MQSSDVAGDFNGDLDLNGNDILNVSDITTTTDRASLRTPGSGNGAVELYDAAAGDWSMRATEGADQPGPVKFQSPIQGTARSSESAPSLIVNGGVDTDELSVDSWDVIDVSEQGIEPESDDDLGAFIQNHFNRQEPNESVIYYLPNGTYTWNTAVEADEFATFGLVGKPQATVKCTNPEMPYFIRAGVDRPGYADIFIAQDIEFDIQQSNVAASAMIASVDEYLEMDHCRLVGEIDRIVPPYYSIHPTLLTETGQGFVNIAMPDGSFYDPDLTEQEHPMGLAIERDHRGYLVIENSDIAGFINNGIYSAGHNGKVAIRNTEIKNCGAGNIRLGDGDFAYKCKITNTDAEDRGYSYAALWVNKAHQAVADSIRIDAQQRTPSELVRVGSDVDHCTLSNITIDSSANQYICDISGNGSDRNLGRIVARNWTIYDSGSAQSNAHLGRITRSNVILENWDVHMDPESDGKRHGLLVDAPWLDVRAVRSIIPAADWTFSSTTAPITSGSRTVTSRAGNSTSTVERRPKTPSSPTTGSATA